MRHRYLKHRHGFTLVETLVGPGILAIVALAGLKYYDHHKQKLANNQMHIAMHHAMRSIENILDNKGSLAVSANHASNTALKSCLPDDYEACEAGDTSDRCHRQTTEPCASLASNAWVPFTLYHPQTLDPLSGTTHRPAGFDQRGRICEASPCAFHVSTWFKPQCFPGQTNCEAAQMLTLAYEIKPNSSRSGNDASDILTMLPTLNPTDGVIAAVRVEREVDVGFSNIWTRLNQRCPDGYGVRGISYAYELHCEDPKGDIGNPTVIPHTPTP